MKLENVEDIYELSPAQQGILFHTLYSPKSGMYLEQFNFTLHADVNASALERAWQQVVDRHPVLRTSLHWEDLDKPLQVVHRQVKLPLEQHDWCDLCSTEQTERLRTYLQADQERGFELSKAPLLRVAVIRLAEAAYQLIVSFHHVILDGWSGQLVFKDFASFYEASCRRQDLHLEPSRPYGDYIAWLQQQDLSEAEVFWRRLLKGYKRLPPLGVDRAPGRLPDQEDVSAEQQIKISSETTAALQAVARQHQLTLNTLLQGAWALLLSHYTGEEDVAFGATVSGRPAALKGVESMVGLFVNTLPVRVQVLPQTPLIPWLKELQAQQFEARQYEYSPLVRIQEWGGMPRGTPLFESLLAFENYPVDGSFTEQRGSDAVGRLDFFERTNYSLTLIAIPGPQLWMKVMYVRPAFERATIIRMLGHLQTLLEGMVANSVQCLSELTLLTQAERRQLLVEWNDTVAAYPRDTCIHGLFEAQVERTPDAVALVFGDERLTYRDLNRRANQLGHYLRSQGVGPEVLVGIGMKRSPEMMVGLLGILKAGGAYVPLELNYPMERLSFMVEDAQLQVLLTEGGQLEAIGKPGMRVICMEAEQAAIGQESDQNLTCPVTAENLAYVMYTSGSTGKPKGVGITHRGVVRLVINSNYVEVRPEDVFLQFAPISFDASTFEIWGSLLNGARLVVYPPQMPVLEDLGQAIQQHGVTTLWLTAGLFHQMVEEQLESLGRVRQLLAGGDVLSVAHVRRALEGLPECRLINGYGPTENTTFTCTHWIAEAGNLGTSVPIGRPIANTRVYVLDRYRNPVPVGVAGELYLGGDGLARGYLNQPDLTSEKFVSNPFSSHSGERLYRSGDRVRYRTDGSLEFLGRQDYQVKIRGFRVELGEVEAVLSGHPAIGECVVQAREEVAGHKQLVAYVAVQPQMPVSVNDLRSFVRERLPEYMVPSAFVLLEALPRNPNGKLDRKSLPPPDPVRLELEGKFVPPRTPVEEVLAGIWAEVLGLERVGVEDNFFELGGHSLIATRLISHVREVLQVEVPLRHLFEGPSIAGLAKSILRDPGRRIKVEKTAQLLLTLDRLSPEEVEARLREKKVHEPERAT